MVVSIGLSPSVSLTVSCWALGTARRPDRASVLSMYDPGLGQAEDPESPSWSVAGIDPGPGRRFDPPDGDTRPRAGPSP